MRRNLVILFILFICCITCGSLFVWNRYEKKAEQWQSRDYVVDLNEVQKQLENGETIKASQSIASLEKKMHDRSEEDKIKELKWYFVWYNVFCVLILGAIFFYLYRRIVHPFHKLEQYAALIAQGNLDIQLSYERDNMFGEFTWAFDHMRTEIRRARQSEKEAIENNKTVIATLSHDIKTPLASIRTYAEALEANLDHNVERREKYISVLIRKCDEVTKLTNDLFLHSLSDLDKLKIKPVTLEIEPFLREKLVEHSLVGEVCNAKVMVDARRLGQVLENITSNAAKYADSPVVKWKTGIEDGFYRIDLEDNGPGIPDADMPFIFQKFYRGENVGDCAGAGLGLYIVQYVMEQMSGKVTAKNTTDGLLVSIYLKLE